MLRKYLVKITTLSLTLTLLFSTLTYASDQEIAEATQEDQIEQVDKIEEVTAESEENSEEATTEESTEENSEEPTEETSEEGSDYSMEDEESSSEENTEENSEETEENGDEQTEEPEEVEEPKEENPYEKPEEEKSEVERLRWDISEGMPRTKTFNIPVPSHTIRMEFFYSAKAPAPIYNFRSTYGSVYGSNNTKDRFTDGDFTFLKRVGLPVNDYSDMRYDVVYISNPPDTGKWELTIILDEDETEFFALSSAVPENWETMRTDYKTAPIEILTWAIDSTVSSYKASDITQIVARENPPAGDNIQAVPAPTEEPFFTPIRIAVFALIITVAIVAFLIFKVNKDTKEKAETIQRKRIEKANTKFSQLKKNEDDSLEEYMNSFSDDYTDDEVDIENYFSSNDQELEREEKRIKEQRNNPNWLKEDIDELVNKIDDNVNPEKDIPSWIPKKEVPPPEWMSETSSFEADDEESEDEGFF